MQEGKLTTSLIKFYKGYLVGFNTNKSKFEVYMISGMFLNEIFSQIPGANNVSAENTQVDWHRKQAPSRSLWVGYWGEIGETRGGIQIWGLEITVFIGLRTQEETIVGIIQIIFHSWFLGVCEIFKWRCLGMWGQCKADLWSAVNFTTWSYLSHCRFISCSSLGLTGVWHWPVVNAMEYIHIVKIRCVNRCLRAVPGLQAANTA